VVDSLKKVQIYTDGACRGNGKAVNIGAYGIVLMFGETIKEVKKAFSDTTNNIMELTSVVDALTMLKEPCDVTIYSDSAYVVNGLEQKWLYGWMKNNWKTSTGKPVKNQELWMALSKLLDHHKVKFVKVKGHSDNQWNNRCDELANMAMDEEF
jgi:ribonuclease HI